MRQYRDPLGRPIRRLYLKTDLLDRRCEGLMREFMNRRSGGYRLPIPTNELMRLLDERAGEIDPYADLPKEIHGRTTFYFKRRPQVEISASIYMTRSDHRVRTTVCHEFGHVWLHGPLWREVGAKRATGVGPVWKCYRENILTAPESDWTEWQAGWISGAILMPASALRAWAAECAKKFSAKLPFAGGSRAGAELIKLVAERCDVSISAAKVRLSKLRLVIGDSSPARHLKEKRGISRDGGRSRTR
jgi:IrrE N-terminal-like domain